MLKKSKRESSLTSRSSDKILSSPELLSKSDFALKKRRKNKLKRSKEPNNWCNKPSYRNNFHLNKQSLIYSLNQLSKNANYKQMNFSNESLSDVSLSFSDDSSSKSKSSSLDTVTIGPYLSRFEQENLYNAKTHLIKDLADKNDIYESLSNNFSNKFFIDSINKPIVHDLLKSSKYLIPWEYIETKSANLIIELFNSNENIIDFDFFDINGNLINHKQVYKWISILKDIYYEKMFKTNEIVLPINDSEISSNRVKLHSNEEIFDEVTEESFESSSSKSDYFNRFNTTTTSKSSMPTSNQKESEIIKKKSPEKQMLYYDWFDIVKKIQRDPNFDLETMIRTRGRFTDHQNINYRDILKQKSRQNLTKSECNLGPRMNKFKKISNDLNTSSKFIKFIKICSFKKIFF